MGKHKPDSDGLTGKTGKLLGHARITVRPDHIIFVEPIGYMTSQVVEHILGELRTIVSQFRTDGYAINILIDISGITGHTSGSRSAIKKASALGFDKGAAYGGSVALGLIMQYLQRSIDPKRAHYFRSQGAALEYLKSPTTESKTTYRSVSSSFVIISVILLIVFTSGAGIGWAYTNSQVNGDSHDAFVQKVQSTRNNLQKRMDVYIEALYGFRGLFNANKSVERNEFDAYFNGLNLTTDFPGFNAISYIAHVKRGDLAAFTNSVRHDTSVNPAGYPSFLVYPANEKQTYDVATYREPAGETLGFDLSSDPVRQSALERARDSSLPTASGTIALSTLQPSEGFLVAMPIYTGKAPTTIELRRAQLSGFVTARFIYSTLFRDALSGLNDDNISVKIRDTQNKVIYELGRAIPSGQSSVSTIVVAGETFTTEFTAPKIYGLPSATRLLPEIILVGGLCAVAFLGVVLVTLLKSRSQAVRLASTMTADLEHERNLAVENQAKLRQSEHALALEKASVEQKVVERTRELNEARAQLEASLHGLPFGFVILNHIREIVFSNDALGKILGKQIAADPKQTETILAKLSAELEPRIDIAHLLRDAEMNLQLITKECMLGARYLKLLFIPIITAPEKAVSGGHKVVGSMMIIEDMTDERALQRGRDEFFSIASHELRTPLTVVRGNASIILDHFSEKFADPSLKQMVTDIESSSTRLINIVNDFLFVSELEQGKISARKKPADLVSVVSGVTHMFQDDAKKQGITLHIEKPKTAAVIPIDENHVEHILRDLLSNALRFTKSGGITVTIKMGHDKASVVVTDTGGGIPVENQHLLFRKFQQASHDILTRDSSQSTGLGLYISRLLAEQMGGTLYLKETTVGKGSTFVLEVPIA